MFWRCQSLKQEHPKVRHEIAGDAIVGVVEQNSHGFLVLLVPIGSGESPRERAGVRTLAEQNKQSRSMSVGRRGKASMVNIDHSRKVSGFETPRV
jgi:hypothetical protein